jgi:hypothetical protein
MNDPMNRPVVSNGPNAPIWWTDQHTSSWDRVKDAFRRDWEQTKSDFSSASGPNLNQNVSDTVQQAFGSVPMPPAGLKTRPSDPKDAVQEANEARARMVHAAERSDAAVVKAQQAIRDNNESLDEEVTRVRRDMASQQLAGAEKIAAATQAAATDIQKQNAQVTEATGKRDAATARWHQAEQEARYGFASHTQRPNDVWNEALESSLRTEWMTMGTDWSWDASRAGIRRGWDYASRTR